VDIIKEATKFKKKKLVQTLEEWRTSLKMAPVKAPPSLGAGGEMNSHGGLKKNLLLHLRDDTTHMETFYSSYSAFMYIVHVLYMLCQLEHTSIILMSISFVCMHKHSVIIL
jgi:hypothetical protein